MAAERSGSVALTVAIAASVLFAMGAVAIDGGRLYLLRRQQQGAADLAAVAAAANLGQASAAAAASLAANGLSGTSLAAVELGTYAPDAALPAAQRFSLGGARPNAARVTLKASASTFFGGFIGAPAAAISTRAVAVNADTAAVALGSTLASLNGGMVNAVLSGLTGSALGLSALDVANLASADVDLFGFANALSLRAGVAGTYATLAGATVRLADLFNAAADAVAAGGGPSGAVTALRAMAGALGPSGPSVAVGSLVAFGAYGNLALGSAPPVAAPLPLLPLVGAAARIGAGLSTVSIDLSGGLLPSGIGRASLQVALGPAAGSTFSAVGPVGLTLHTAQTRALLILQLLPLDGAPALSLPLYVEVAPATAALTGVGCSAGAPVDPAATLAVSPGAVDGWIGAVPDGALANAAAPVTPGPAILAAVSLPLLGSASVTGRAHATVSNTRAAAVPFTRADVAAGTMKSTATADYAGSLLGQLFAGLQLGASTSTLGVASSATLPPGTAAAIGAMLRDDLAPIDAVLAGALSALGVTVGDADTWVRAVRCGQGALVN